MTELVIVEVGDTWVNSLRPGANYSGTTGTRVKSGERLTLLRPELPNISGRTVVVAYLVAHGAQSLAAQTIHVTPINSRWSPGRVTWSNRPTTNGALQVSTGIGATAADVPVTLPNLAQILQAVADGTDWYGLQLSTSSTTDQRFRAVESGLPAWELHIELSDVPEIPANLRPDGGAVATSRPILVWDYLDFDTTGDASEQAKFRVQVDTPAGVEPDAVAPDFTSAWTTSADSSFNLATSTHTPAGNGPHYWRVQVEDADGNISGWSDWADYTVAAMPSLILDSPVGAFGDPSPTIQAHLSVGTLSHWKAIITGPDRSDVRARSGLQTGPIVWEVPFRNKDGRRVLRDNKRNWLRLRAWDTTDRTVTVGQSPYAETWYPLDFDDDLTVAAPTNLSVVQYADGDPRNVWSWSHNETPKVFVAQVDGVTIARLDPADLTVNAGVWTWTDSGQVSPLRPHTLSVRAVEPISGVKRSKPATVTERSHVVKGVWLLSDDSGEPIVLTGNPVGGFAHSDRVATYTPVKGPDVDVIYDHEGLRGAFEGGVDSRHEDVWATLDRLEELRTSRTRTARMVWGSQSIMVRLRDISPTSSELMLPSNLLHVVRFGFVEVG